MLTKKKSSTQKTLAFYLNTKTLGIDSKFKYSVTHHWSRGVVWTFKIYSRFWLIKRKKLSHFRRSSPSSHRFAIVLRHPSNPKNGTHDAFICLISIEFMCFHSRNLRLRLGLVRSIDWDFVMIDWGVVGREFPAWQFSMILESISCFCHRNFCS